MRFDSGLAVLSESLLKLALSFLDNTRRPGGAAGVDLLVAATASDSLLELASLFLVSTKRRGGFGGADLLLVATFDTDADKSSG